MWRRKGFGWIAARCILAFHARWRRRQRGALSGLSTPRLLAQSHKQKVLSLSSLLADIAMTLLRASPISGWWDAASFTLGAWAGYVDEI